VINERSQIKARIYGTAPRRKTSYKRGLGEKGKRKTLRSRGVHWLTIEFSPSFYTQQSQVSLKPLHVGRASVPGSSQWNKDGSNVSLPVLSGKVLPHVFHQTLTLGGWHMVKMAEMPSTCTGMTLTPRVQQRHPKRYHEQEINPYCACLWGSGH
jgi:hypothetical protein